jgi:hypothetical protein
MIIAAVIFVVLAVLVITNRIAGQTFVGKVLLAFDLFVNVLWDRDFDISISSTCGLYWRHDPPLFWYMLHQSLNGLQKGHCESAIVGDLARAQAAIKLLS